MIDDPRESILWHRMIVRGLATREQLHLALGQMAKETGVTFGALLVRMGIATADQIAEMESIAGRVAVRCRGCGSEREVSGRLLKGGVACPKCKGRMEIVVDPPAAAPPAPVLRAPAPTRPWKRILVGSTCVAAVILAILIAVVASRSRGRAPIEEPAPSPAAKVPPKRDPSPSDSLEARLRALREREKARPNDCRSLHGGWSEILDQVRGTATEEVVREKLEELESRANKLYREAYRPVQEAVRELAGQGKPLEAHQRLQAWKPPPELEIDGRNASDRAKEIAALVELIALERMRSSLDRELRGGTDVDPSAAMTGHLASGHVAVRAEAERSLVELRSVRGIEQIRRRLAGRRTGALARVEAAARQLAADTEEEATRFKRWQARVAELSAKKPWPLKSLGVDLPGNVAVKNFGAGGVTFAGEGIEFTWSLDAVKPEMLGDILVLAADPASGIDNLEAGKWSVRRKAYDAAQRLFDRAVKADPALAPVIPDLYRIRRGVASVRGILAVSADQLSIDYDFRSDEQLKDFQVTPETGMTAGSCLTLSGLGLFTALLKEMQFAGRVRISAETGGLSPDAGYLLGVSYEVAAQEFDQILVVLQGDRVWRVFRRPSRGQERELARGEASSSRMLELSLEGMRASVTIGGGEVWAGEVDSYDRVQALIGGVAYSEGGAAVRYSSLKIAGRASPSWIQRLRAERTTVLEAELAKDARVTREELAAALVSGNSFGSSPAAALPIESELAPAIPPRVAEKLAVVRDVVKALAQAKTPAVWDELVQEGRRALDEAVREAPWFGPALYYSAEWRYALEGHLDGALSDLAKAAAVQPQLVEARMASATLLLALSDGAGAERELSAALEAVPDLAAGRLLRARLLHFAGKPAEALKELELAWRLAPGDAGVRQAAKRLRNAVVGPRWATSVSMETTHYRLRAEIPASANAKEQLKLAATAKERLQSCAARLEAVRVWIPQLAPGASRRTEKPQLFLFGSAEGYYVYAEFTLSDRMEHSVGCYLPDVRQLLFFEDTSSEETIETMVHESFHEYLDSIAPGAPAWLNEGMAEYVAGAEVEGGAVVRVGVVKGRLRLLKAWLDRGAPMIGFATIMRESQAQFYSTLPDLQYAQAWAMVHFLRHGAGGRHRDLLDRYIAMLVQGKNGDDAYAETFAKEDLGALQQDFLRHVKGL